MGRVGFRERLEEAVAWAEGGQKAEAEAQLRALVAEGARLPKAAMALGVLCGERGDLGQRRLWLQHAQRLEDTTGEVPSLRLRLNLLVDALEQGQAEQAVAYGQEALGLDPEDGETQLFVASAYSALGEGERAAHHLKGACGALGAQLAANPEDVKAWRLLATAEQQLERIDAAIAAHLRALAIEPNHLPTLLTVSGLLIDRGQIDRAMPWLMNALAVDPENTRALTMAGHALQGIGESTQAIELYRRALAIDPSLVETCFLLGGTLSDLGFYSEAEKAFRDGLATDPQDFNCRMNLATTLRNQGSMAEAVAIYQGLLAEAEDPKNVYGAFTNLMFTYSISAVASPAEVLACAESFWKRMEENSSGPRQLATPGPVEGRPLRVGLLSADIGSHVVGRFLDPLLRHHDPLRTHLELVSMRRRYEESSEALIGLADGFHSLEGLPAAQARDLLRQQNYDLIVDTSGYTRNSGLHLLAERCAPVQAHYIGYHATTGLPTIDWFIGDGETASEELQDQFSERLWRLPRPWLAYPSETTFPEATALMTTDRPVLGSFSQVPKITATTLDFWAEALRRVPSALLVLKDRGVVDPEVRNALETNLKARGIEPTRLAFLPPEGLWQDHVDFYNILDVALDTTPWSSATTCFEALAMGTPMVAIRGQRMAARMSSSLVKGLGMENWVAETPHEFGLIVETLCRNLSDLRNSKNALQQRTLSSALFNGKDLAYSLQEGFAAISNYP
ncbi:MAG: tetratricopeptide repeat protein [Cyanobium sp.]